MGMESCSRISRRAETRNGKRWLRPLGLGASGRGLLPGLHRASVTQDCTALHQEQRKEPSTTRFDDLKASCKDLHASTAVPALSSFLHGHLGVVHAVITVYPWPFYFLMAFAPRAGLTKRLLTGAKSLVPLAVLYGILLVASWTPETLSTLLPGDFTEGMKSALQGQPKMQFLPEIQAVGKLLSAPIASVSAWAHLQFIAFFCARWIWMDGLMRGVNTVHSVLLCAVLPPLGFLAHIVTTFLKRQFGTGAAPATSSIASSASARASGNGAAPPTAPGDTTPATSSAQPSSEGDGWAAATASVGVAGSHPRTADSNGNGAAEPAAAGGNGASADPPAAAGGAEEAAADAVTAGRPGGRSRDMPAPTSSGNGASSAAARADDDRSWLTVLEPEYVQRN